MKTLCMDTSHRYLVLVLMENDEIKASKSMYAWKKQSETIFVELINLMEAVSWQPDDIDEVVITVGPGSYTGIRIAMSIAKVFCSSKKKTLYTISTLQLYAGLDTCSVMLDARSNRVYYGKYQQGKCLAEGIKTLDEIKALSENMIGDVSLIGKEDKNPDFVLNFKELRPYYKKVDNIHGLVPRYLKEESAYLVK
ncbi:tRNA threonylcarbamoyladenosine biosynthesis protein TsaB [Breznakia sp. PF5-3]|uniref:tRNA (adenosine(37)-N6)-threonylcarbamoyltransferase complex dimerization subunit type 1 TsaB n=1 Tax=unclassified Breznakia TaxID=2623764 RepID=UPI002406AEA4|nr:MULTISPECIES: tRNA (adenosine(37)-N6)-threonylcarbamoyltransferase complex dimerization subunit type 1 TsaB [unclassified Breznakia]MDF9824477.1 tRNA threonylcarbamoyladenosine biosynthesis protein TsaB [Breznakia sp. PM6-1]MDF9835240.1 tRNA threonylcarbamoyladenosine biosynthesis protein TsaB [Breznakia sp. PF5-3]MDF9837432.1 tRNA threonylcarbamoyladenosine biosynthesis protein TsaB [Breznakia sp. PFB2-8]MDF9859368.1 tRNA threonylcarbamoyladenosine biosynthesis protein TsaB [Breznakia sp. P